MWYEDFDLYGYSVGPDYEGMILARQEAYEDCPPVTAVTAFMRVFVITAMMEVYSEKLL